MCSLFKLLSDHANRSHKFLPHCVSQSPQIYTLSVKDLVSFLALVWLGALGERQVGWDVVLMGRVSQIHMLPSSLCYGLRSLQCILWAMTNPV